MIRGQRQLSLEVGSKPVGLKSYPPRLGHDSSLMSANKRNAIINSYMILIGSSELNAKEFRR